MTGGEAGQAALHPRIRAVELGPSLLEKADPELTVTRCRESWRSIRLHGQVVINHYGRFFAVLEESDQVYPGSVDCLSVKHSANTVWKLRQRAQCSQKVAVAQSALVHIIWIDAIFENARALIDLTGAFPLQLLAKILRLLVCVNVRVKQTGRNWPERIVDPRLALLNLLFDHSFELPDVLQVLPYSLLRLLRQSYDSLSGTGK